MKSIFRTKRKILKLFKCTVETYPNNCYVETLLIVAENKEDADKPDVDGGLIGGAALKADDFSAIVNAI